MKVEFLKKFSKDLDGVNLKSVKVNAIKIIELMETVNSLDEIPNTKKQKVISQHIEQGQEIIGWVFSLKMQQSQLPDLFTEKTSTKFSLKPSS